MAGKTSDLGWLWRNMTKDRKTIFIVYLVVGLLASGGLTFVPILGPICGPMLFFIFLAFAWLGALTSCIRGFGSDLPEPQKKD